MPKNEKFGKYLTSKIAENNLTNYGLSKLSGIAPNEIKLLALGQRTPRAETLKKLSAALNVSIEELIENIY